MYFVSLDAMLFRVEPIVFFGVVCRWCAVLEPEVLSTTRSTGAESLHTRVAMEPHGRGADKQWAFPAGRPAVAGDRDMDVNLPPMGTDRGQTVPLPHDVALRAFGSGAATLLLVVLLGRIVRVGRPFAQAHVKPPLFVRIFLACQILDVIRGWGQVWCLCSGLPFRFRLTLGCRLNSD